MIRNSLINIILCAIFFIIISCSEDIGVNEFTYQCSTDNDCKEGYVCDKVRGCIKVSKDAGRDSGADVAGDIVDDIVGDVEDAGDIEDIRDIYDIYEDVGDIVEIEDIEEISDITDGGIDVQVSYILRLESVYDSSAGVCTSPNYILESVTGFTASDEMRSSSYILHRSMLFKR